MNANSGVPTLTIDGAVGAWDNMGTFNAGSSTVVFTNANATTSDPTNFYNVTVASGARLTLGTNNIMRIAGALTITGILNASYNYNTIEFNGSIAQSIPNPNGSTSGYSNLILSGSGTKTLAATLDIVDQFTNNGSVNFGTGSVNLNGNSSDGQEISGTSTSNFYNLNLNNSGYGASLKVNAGVTNALTLTKGKLTIGNSDLTLGNTATISGGNSSNYIITNGIGLLSQRVNNDASDVVYPIGVATSYLPIRVQLTSGSTADNIKARVGDGIYSSYSSNVPTGSLITSNVVRKTWYLQEGVVGGSSATVKVQWNAEDEGASFDNTKSNISLFNGSAWKYVSSSEVSGGGPFTQSISGITSFYPLGVFEQTLSGNVNYYNLGNTSLTSGVTVKLFQSNEQVGSDYAVTNGSYLFKGLPPGAYEIRATSGMSANGAVNGTDAAQVNYWGVHPYSIQKVRFHAGDVSGGSPIAVNSTDALAILQNFVNGTPFNSVWSFWETGAAIANNPTVEQVEFTESYPSFTLDVGRDSIVDMYGLYIGDFNMSYNFEKTMSTTLDLVPIGILNIGSQQEFDLPIYLMNSGSIGAVSLVLNFPADLVSIEDVTMNTNEGVINWAVQGNELRIGWYSPIAMELSAGDIMAVLHLKTTQIFNDQSIIEFSLAANSANELADGQYEIIPNAIIGIDAIIASSTSVQDLSNQDPSNIKLKNYPNPFSGITTLVYELPCDGQVNLEIYDIVGRVINTLVSEVKKQGVYNQKFDANILPPGIYMARLTLITEGKKVIRNIKLINNN